MKVNNTRFFILLCILLFSGATFSQNTTLDSLEKELNLHPKPDTVRVNLLISLSSQLISIDIINAQKKAEEANSLAKKLNFKKGEAGSFLRLSRIHRKKSELDVAEKYAQNALKLYEEINSQKGVNYSNTSLAQVAYYKNDADKAIEYYNKVLNDNIKSGDSLNQAERLNDIGAAFYLKGDLDSAMTYFKKSYAIRDRLGEKKLSLSTLNNIGVICLNQGRYPEALGYLNQSLSIHREMNNKEGIARCTYNISAVYYELDQYEKSLRFLEESLILYRELGDTKQIASCLVNIGAVYSDLKEFSKALEYMTKSLAISKEIDDKDELSAGYFQLGDLRLLMGQPSKALKNYQTCLDISLLLGSKIYTCHANIGIARALVELKDYDKALHHVKEGKKIADELELLSQQQMAAGLLADIYSKIGNYKKAFESHQQFKILNDSLFNKKNIEKITQLEYEYKYKQELELASFRELKLTKTVNETTQNLEKSQRNMLVGVIVFLSIILILGAIIFFLRLRNVKSEVQTIAVEQKLLRSQMTPHFIFNSLSVLQGMILNKEEKKSVSYLSKFSKLLRIILENSRYKTVSLQQELEAIENYLSLQNLENESYQYSIIVDDNIDKTLFQIPPMLIQPFVENAIEHAFDNQTKNQNIEIHLSYIHSDLICTITDNGIGINAQKENKRKDKKSLSTTITSERLKILANDFNTKGAMSIEDRQKYNKRGTIVRLVIPYKS